MTEGWCRNPITSPCFCFLSLHQLKPLIMSVLFFPSGFFQLIKTWKQNGKENMFCSSAGCWTLWGQQCGGLYLNCTDMNSITEACCSQGGNADTCIPLWCLFKRAALNLSHAQGMTSNWWEACSLCEACPFIPFPPPYTIYKRQSVALRMSCKPQLSLHKRIQQTDFIYKNPLQKKSWKCFVMPIKICTINCLTLWDKEWMNKGTDSIKQCLYL